MDQVRELLMGTQLKDMENRAQRQEEQFMREIAALRDSVKNRVESLENFMKSEAASLLHRLQEEQAERAATLKGEQKERMAGLRAEQQERNEAVKKEHKERDEALAQLAKDIARELAAKEGALERKLAALSSTLDTAEQELRQLMLSENARLSEKIEEKHKEALNALTSASAQIRDDVVSRSAISALFAEAAVRFSGQAGENPLAAGKEDKPGPAES